MAGHKIFRVLLESKLVNVQEMFRKKIVFLLTLLAASGTVKSQNKEKTGYPRQKFFGSIYTGFFYDWAHKKAPYIGFELSTALFGYYSKISDKVTVKLIYDVTRTTSDIRVTDTLGTPMDVLYFEGSQYTAFLKQAEIDWKFAPNYELAAGQLLNQQYLTVQDKFWGYRFVAVTLQEMYRLGNPADFGIRLTRFFGKKGSVSLGAVNGDGPFRKQDAASGLLFFFNAESRPDNFILKWYSDYISVAEAFHNSLFVAYQKEHNRIGVEYTRIDSLNYAGTDNASQAVGIYSSYTAAQKVDLFLRGDILTNVAKYGIKDGYKLYAGINYHESTFNTSLNVRYYNIDKSLMLYWQFGVKF